MNAIRDLLAPDAGFSRSMYANLLSGFMVAASKSDGSLGIMFCRACLKPVFLCGSVEKIAKCSSCGQGRPVAWLRHSRRVGVMLRDAFAKHSLGLAHLTLLNEGMIDAPLQPAMAAGSAAEKTYRELNVPGMLARVLLGQAIVAIRGGAGKEHVVDRVREAASIAAEAEAGMKEQQVSDTARQLLQELQSSSPLG